MQTAVILPTLPLSVKACVLYCLIALGVVFNATLSQFKKSATNKSILPDHFTIINQGVTALAI